MVGGTIRVRVLSIGISYGLLGVLRILPLPPRGGEGYIGETSIPLVSSEGLPMKSISGRLITSPCYVADGFCLLCYENRKGRGAHAGHRYYVAPKTEVLLFRSQLMKRAAPPPKGGKTEWSCPDPEFGKKFPTLAEFLCDSTWDDGKPREVGSLTVRLGGETVFVGLSDYEAGASLFCNAESLSEALSLIDGALKTGKGKWKRWKK